MGHVKCDYKEHVLLRRMHAPVYCLLSSLHRWLLAYAVHEDHSTINPFKDVITTAVFTSSCCCWLSVRMFSS